MRARERKHSCKKYWLVLFCWMLAPMFASKVLDFPLRSIHIIFMFATPYWLFVMATTVYERYYMFDYLRKHYPYEYKKLKRLETGTEKERLEYRDFLDSFSPEDDKEWEMIQLNLEEHMRFVLASYLSVACFSFIYLVFLAVD